MEVRIKMPQQMCDKCKHPIAYWWIENDYIYWYCVCWCYTINAMSWETIKYNRFIEVYNNNKWDNRSEFYLTQDQLKMIEKLWSIRIIEKQSIKTA